MTGRPTQRHNPLLASLTQTPDESRFEIRAIQSQTYKLRHPQPGSVQNLDHGAISEADGTAHIRSSKQLVDFFEIEKMRQRDERMRSFHGQCGILVRGPFEQKKSMEAAHRGQCARRRPWLQATRVQEPDERRNVRGTRAAKVGSTEMLTIHRQIMAIRGKCICG